MKKLSTLAAASLLAMSTFTYADEAETTSNVRPLFMAGLTFGGDELYKVEYEDGSDEELSGGGLFLLGGGFNTKFEQFNLQTTLAYHFDSAGASNGDVSFSRWEAEVIPFIQTAEQHRFGIGLGYHFGAELESDFSFDKTTIEFDSALALILEYGYILEGDAGVVGVRYVNVDYDISKYDGFDVGFANASVSGNHLGIMYYYHF